VPPRAKGTCRKHKRQEISTQFYSDILKRPLT